MTPEQKRRESQSRFEAISKSSQAMYMKRLYDAWIESTSAIAFDDLCPVSKSVIRELSVIGLVKVVDLAGSKVYEGPVGKVMRGRRDDAHRLIEVHCEIDEQ